jgi:TPR repeat protein
LAMVALSDAFLGGHGLPRDPREAARWAKEARRESSSGMG